MTSRKIAQFFLQAELAASLDCTSRHCMRGLCIHMGRPESLLGRPAEESSKLLAGSSASASQSCTPPLEGRARNLNGFWKPRDHVVRLSGNCGRGIPGPFWRCPHPGAAEITIGVAMVLAPLAPQPKRSPPADHTHPERSARPRANSTRSLTR